MRNDKSPVILPRPLHRAIGTHPTAAQPPARLIASRCSRRADRSRPYHAVHSMVSCVHAYASSSLIVIAGWPVIVKPTVSWRSHAGITRMPRPNGCRSMRAHTASSQTVVCVSVPHRVGLGRSRVGRLRARCRICIVRGEIWPHVRHGRRIKGTSGMRVHPSARLHISEIPVVRGGTACDDTHQ